MLAHYMEWRGRTTRQVEEMVVEVAVQKGPVILLEDTNQTMGRQMWMKNLLQPCCYWIVEVLMKRTKFKRCSLCPNRVPNLGRANVIVSKVKMNEHHLKYHQLVDVIAYNMFFLE